MGPHHFVVAMTGASGSLYGLALLEALIRAKRVIHFTMSPAAVQVLRQETDRVVVPEQFRWEDLLGRPPDPEAASNLHYYDYRDFSAGIASGSFLTGGMVICPCSMGTAGAIAHGLSQNLIQRAADVHLKERRKLVLVPRETPMSLVQLRNLALCAEAGAVVLPANPGFYTRPNSINDLVNFVVARICDQLGVANDLMPRWGSDEVTDG